MTLNRRRFLTQTVALAAASTSHSARGALPAEQASPPDFSQLRKDFPRALNQPYFNSAAQHPLSVHSVKAIHDYTEFMMQGPGEDRQDYWEKMHEVKALFAELIHAQPTEIAFVPSTTWGENLIVNGLEIEKQGGNVVTNDLHYTSCLHAYRMRAERTGLDVRIVRHRDWRTDLQAMQKAIDRNTRLVAVSLVSSVNGFVEDVAALSRIAHAHGAYLFADIIQGCGCTPIDVRAMGIDFASCAMYKWLMGEHGSGFLYIREDLQDSVVKPTLFGGSVELNYPPWVDQPAPGREAVVVRSPKGASRFELGTYSAICYAAQDVSLRYIRRLGVERIQAHARELIARLQKELPKLGYRSITPLENPAPIATFLMADPEAVRRKLRTRTNITFTGPNSALTVGRFGNHLRVSVSVFNNHDDLDRLISALA